jgi:hypothetical protein
MHKHPLLRSFVAGVAPALLLVSSVVAAPLTGAIFTTDSGATLVNGNIYALKTDVFLTGGPQNCINGSGLPDGDYFFQVTTPSGAPLSTDAIDAERRVTVSGGVVSAYLGNTHAVGTGQCGGISVGLAPFDNTTNPGGEYKAWMTRVTDYDGVSGFNGFHASDSKTDNFRIANGVTPTRITGYKFYDSNTNGVQDTGEPAIPGWHIEKSSSTTLTDVAYTDSNGQYQFNVNKDNMVYSIAEVPPGANFFPIGPWLNTSPISGPVTANASGDILGPNFSNVCLGAGGGLTLGFWSNKNGQSRFGSDDLALLLSLNLRNASGANFDPASYAAFRSWVLGATATNMSYMLSAQLAAMELNVANGLVNGNAMIYAPGATVNPAGFASVNSIMAQANTELGTHGSAVSGTSYRTYQEALKNALDRANNNINFVQVPVNGAVPCTFESPY